MRIAIYNTTTGIIKRHMVVPPAMVDIQCEAGEEFYLNCPPSATYIINNVPLVIPPIPSMDVIRRRRNYLLAQCDWTQLPDAPVDKSAWAIYRQQLRDFPAICDPANPVWPIPPQGGQ